MPQLIAFCGLDCGMCEGFIATQANDTAAQELVAAKWRKEYNAPEITLADVTCDGCVTASGRLGGYCPRCPIRACAITHEVSSCAHCAEYVGCAQLDGMLAQVPAARATLEALRRA